MDAKTNRQTHATRWNETMLDHFISQSQLVSVLGVQQLFAVSSDHLSDENGSSQPVTQTDHFTHRLRE